ncbi:RICIN domain-containing protein [Kitasatospora sp. NPDC001159]
MKKINLGRFAVAAVAAATVGFATAGPAFADGYVQWKDAATGRCLTWNNDGVLTTPQACGRSYGDWYEQEVSTGVFRMYPYQDQGRKQCLDSSDAGRVYLNPCNSSNYQKWRETKTSTGWRLTNVATSRVLDSNFKGSVYTNPDEGDSNEYQRWH